MPQRSSQHASCSSSSSGSASPSISLHTAHQNKRMIAEQRSQSLYDCVLDGEVSLDAILAYPLDWQGLALEHHSSKASSSKLESERISTRSPLQVKRARKPRQSKQKQLVQLSSSSTSILSPFSEPSSAAASDGSALGLGLGLYEPSSASRRSSNLSYLDDSVSPCPPSPALTFSSGEESGFSTPTHDPLFSQAESTSENDLAYSKLSLSQMGTTLSLPLKSYGSFFNDIEEDVVFSQQPLFAY